MGCSIPCFDFTKGTLMLLESMQIKTDVESEPALRVRPRRLRRTANLRALVRETQLSVNDLIYPLFVVHGTHVREEIGSMPGVYHLSVDELAREIERISALDLSAIMLFGLPAIKDEIGSENFAAQRI